MGLEIEDLHSSQPSSKSHWECSEGMMDSTYWPIASEQMHEPTVNQGYGAEHLAMRATTPALACYVCVCLALFLWYLVKQSQSGFGQRFCKQVGLSYRSDITEWQRLMHVQYTTVLQIVKW